MTEDKDNSIKGEFYNRPESVFDLLPSNEIKIEFGGFNGKILNELVHRVTTTV